MSRRRRGGLSVSTMAPDFSGFRPEVFAWFADLEQDNSRTFFAASRELYEEHIRGALDALLGELAETFGGHVHLYRQHRDTRFSADKSPYKTTTYGVLGGAPRGGAGLYAQLSAQGLYSGTGYHQMASDQLQRFRDAIVDDATGPAFEAAIAQAQSTGLQVQGQALKTAPRGYPREHPRIESLRRKAVIAGRRLSFSDTGITRATALRHVTATWQAAMPINDWLDAHVGPSTAPEEGRRRPGSTRDTRPAA